MDAEQDRGTDMVTTTRPASRRRGRGRVVPLLASVATAVALAVGAAAPTASAVDAGSLDSPRHIAFYTPPADVAAAAARNGDLLRHEPMRVAAGLPGLPVPPVAERIMYRSTGAAGTPVAVTGTLLQSPRPWTGRGTRPLAAVAPGTQGQGDLCAPSRGFENLLSIQTAPPSLGAGYEIMQAGVLLDAGFDVVVTDLEGLGTPGDHTYVDRASSAYSTLDAARAALRMPGSRLAPDTPVVFSGYSQGGSAAAAAAEEAARYAPELNAVGAAASAPPADLVAVLDRIDGSLIVGALAYTVNSLKVGNPEVGPEFDRLLNDRGRELLEVARHQCIADSILTFGLQETPAFLADGRRASEAIRENPVIMAALDRQRIGRIAPSVPVRVQGNLHDDAVPYGQVEQLARDWCDLGATVEFVTDPTPPILPRSVINHLAPMPMHVLDVQRYLVDRVNGVPAPNTCGVAPPPR